MALPGNRIETGLFRYIGSSGRIRVAISRSAMMIEISIMAFKFNCSNPECGIHIEADEDWIGQQVECPQCGTALVVPNTKPASNKGKLIGVCAGVAAALGIGGAIFFRGAESAPDHDSPVAEVSADQSGLPPEPQFIPRTGSIVQPVVTDNAETSSSLIWIEGEDADSSNAQVHNWYNSVKREQLSGGDWLNHYSGARPGEAKWRFKVGRSGEHELWVRANATGKARLSWRLNGEGSWREVDFSDKLDTANIASDGKIDMRFVSWVKAGKVNLEAGEATIEFRMSSGVQNHGGLDCFVFSRDPFSPNGKLKPGAKLGLADAGSWAFEPGADPFSKASRIDLSQLNEEIAGMHGFIGHDKHGDFVDGRGQPIRFWAANTTFHQRTSDPDALAYHAKWLARRGVNMVRSHSHLPSRNNNAGVNDVDEKEIDQIRRLVAAMRTEGIYTTISPYWAVATKWRRSLGLPNPEGSNLTGLLFWDEKLQSGYQNWWRELLTEENPYTGIPLAKDPAVAILQLQNEDSLLFFTLQSVKGEARRDLRKKFHDFLVRKHGSINTARSAWGTGNSRHQNDRNGETGLFSIWHLTQNASGAKQNRYADQLEFYGRLMYDFNAKMAKFLREELGCKQLINAGNWKTANAAKLNDIERWSYTANEVIGVNRYFNGGSHVNPTERRKSGYAITKGDQFSGQSVLQQPRRFPLTLKLPAGKPFIISESSWVPPLKYQSEGPFLIAAYSSLTGFDAYYWFAMGDADWGRPMGKWQMNTPMLAGQFPAAAILFRRGYVKRAAPVLSEHRSLDDLWHRRKPLAVEDAGYDPNRDQGTISQLSSVKSTMDPLAYLAGPVEVHYDSDPGQSKLSPPDSAAGVVTSKTGELKWDTNTGICTVDSPKAQGITGFARGQKIDLSSLSIETKNEYITVLAVSLDGKDLSSSSQVLVQIGTTSRPYGWRTRTRGNGKEITNLGQPPWNVVKADLRLSLKNTNITRAEVLDGNFRKTREIPVTGGSFTAPENALYVLLLN